MVFGLICGLFALGCVGIVFLLFRYYISKGVFDEMASPLIYYDVEECLEEKNDV